MTAPEFSRPLRIEAIGEVARTERIEADADERAALARRFGLVSLGRLTAAATICREADAITAEGALDAEVVQTCVVTGEPLPAALHEPFRLRFVPAEQLDADGGEVELDEADCDVVPYAGGAIDLGEAVAETLALALDSFPRSPDADAALAEAGVLGEAEAGPFAGLKALTDRLRPH